MKKNFHQDFDGIPLVVNLDNLICVNMLQEACLNSFVKNPFIFIKTYIFSMLYNNNTFQELIFKKLTINFAALTYNKWALNFIQTQHAMGREIYLITSLNSKAACLVADHFKIFAGVISPERDKHLSEKYKIELLISRFGNKQFDYFELNNSDNLVWPHARSVFIGDYATISTKKNFNCSFISIAGYENNPHSGFNSLIQVLRPHQWLKNLLVLLPILSAHKYTYEAMFDSIIAFCAFSLIASSGYIINDLLDIESDRLHPRKNKRPFASGTLNVLDGCKLFSVVMISALVTASILNLYFMILIFSYFLISILYSFYLKKLPLIDVIVLSALYVSRIVGGSIATGITLSNWLFVFSLFFFLSLALVKRVTELHIAKNLNRSSISRRGYLTSDILLLQQMAISSGMSSIIVFALYINSDAAKSIYLHSDILWIAIPLLILWLSRIHFLANRCMLHDDPVIFAVTDKTSLIIGIIFVLIVILATI